MKTEGYGKEAKAAPCVNVYTRVNTCVCIRPRHQGMGEEKRDHEKDKGRKKRRRWRHTHSRISPPPSLPSFSQ